MAAACGIDVARIPTARGFAYPDIIEGAVAGKIKALWIIATNPVVSYPNVEVLRQAFENLEFLVVQDGFETPTSELADLTLPAAIWGEKEGTFINSERRFGLVKKISPPPGQALSDFNIFKLVAHYWGCGALFKEWTSPEAVFQILRNLSQDQPCDITGIRDYRMIEEHGGIQWPFADPSRKRAVQSPEASTPTHDELRPRTLDQGPETERRLFEDGQFFHPDGKAVFIFEAPRAAPEPLDAAYPFLLLTGRGTSAQWHTQTRTGKSAVLRQLCPANVYLEMNPRDAARLGIRPQQYVLVRSRRGQVKARAFVTATVHGTGEAQQDHALQACHRRPACPGQRCTEASWFLAVGRPYAFR